jgi:hypothetical protein
VTSVCSACFGNCSRLVNITFAPGSVLSSLAESVFSPPGSVSPEFLDDEWPLGDESFLDREF